MTREEADFISGMNMCDEISDEAYKKIMCHCEEQEPCDDAISRQAVEKTINDIRDCISVDGYWAILERVKKLPLVNPQKPCKDAISREAVLMELGKYLCGVPFDEEGIDKVIEKLPSVTPQPKRKWIPVSERLPEDHKNVLIYLSSNQITIGLYNSHRLPFMDKPIGWGADAPHGWSSDEVEAWMPLPKPYKAESEKT